MVTDILSKGNSSKMMKQKDIRNVQWIKSLRAHIILYRLIDA